METYRLSSKLREKEHEYLIQTTNDVSAGAVSTAVYIDGVRAESVSCPHPESINPEEVLSLVKATHGEKRLEIESLLKAFTEVRQRGSAEMACQLGTAFFYKRFYREAAELFEVVLRSEPAHHQAACYMGLTLGSLGDAAGAVRYCQTAVELRPGYADYRNALGEAYLAADDPLRAIGEFEQAVRVNRYYGEAYFNLSLAHLHKAAGMSRSEEQFRTVDRVAEFAGKACMIDPAYQERAEYKVATEALQQRDIPRAMTALRAIRESRKQARRLELASYYMRFIMHPGWVTEKAVADRVRYLEGQLDRNPGYVDLQAELARCYLEQARFLWEKGMGQYRRSADMNQSLTKVTVGFDEAQQVLERINQALARIAEKG